MIVTTARKQGDLADRARWVASQLGFKYVSRKDASIRTLCEEHEVEQVLLVTDAGLKCMFKKSEEQPFYFHPNSAMFRLRRLRKGLPDAFVDAAQLVRGQSVLDCTAGLCSDAIIASYITGESGRVTAVEGEPILAFIVSEGLQRWQTEHTVFDEAMRRIHLIQAEHLTFLTDCAANEYDIVYFDPMFEKTVSTSSGIAPLKKLVLQEDLSVEAIAEARRVARSKVILKDSRHSSRFEKLGFTPLKRPYASHWYGIIEA